MCFLYFPMPIRLRSHLEVQRLAAFEVPFCDVTWLSQMGCPMEEHGISWEAPWWVAVGGNEWDFGNLWLS